jgi:co-chaperonin GroES (HSP10)
MSNPSSPPLKPYKKRILVEPIQNTERVGQLLVPEKFASPHGKGQTGLPHRAGTILAVGEDVADLSPGDTVILNALQLERITWEREEYWLPLAAAVLVIQANVSN